MKNLSVIVILFFILSTKLAYCQEKNLVSGKISIGIELIDIPKEIKSDVAYVIDSKNQTIYKRFSEILKGNVIVVTDLKNKVITAYIPEAGRQSPVLRCFNASFGPSGDGSGWGGFWDCLFG